MAIDKLQIEQYMYFFRLVNLKTTIFLYVLSFGLRYKRFLRCYCNACLWNSKEGEKKQIHRNPRPTKSTLITYGEKVFRKYLTLKSILIFIIFNLFYIFTLFLTRESPTVRFFDRRQSLYLHFSENCRFFFFCPPLFGVSYRTNYPNTRKTLVK